MKVTWTEMSYSPRGGVSTLRCQRCGGFRQLALPISMKDLAGAMRRFNGDHGLCLRIDPPAPAPLPRSNEEMLQQLGAARKAGML